MILAIAIKPKEEGEDLRRRPRREEKNKEKGKQKRNKK